MRRQPAAGGSTAVGETGISASLPLLRRMLDLNGIDGIALGRECGLDLAVADGVPRRFCMDAVDTLIEKACARIADPSWGLTAARCIQPGHLGVVGHAWIASTTLFGALQRMAHYYGLVGQRACFSCTRLSGDGIEIRVVRPARSIAVRDVVADTLMSGVLALCRMSTDDRFHPIRVGLVRERPEDESPYVARFGVPVLFGQDRNSMMFSEAEALAPLPTRNLALLNVLDRMMSAERARLDPHDLVEACKQAIIERLPAAEVTQKKVASSLGMSARSLQRKLAERSLAFGDLLDNVRSALAVQYLCDTEMSMTDITFSLGYNSPASFSRAFHRWTSMSPSEYRTRMPREVAVVDVAG